MSTNGNSGITEQASKLPGAPPRRQTPAAATVVTPAAAAGQSASDVAAQVADLTERIRDIGRYSAEHGRYQEDLCNRFADRLLVEAREHNAELLTSERRKLAELENILGKLRGGNE